MKKTWKIKNLDCANCAAKMERAIAKIEGVQSVTIAFMTQRLTLEADENRWEDILKQAAAACKKIEPDCEIVV